MEVVWLEQVQPIIQFTIQTIMKPFHLLLHRYPRDVRHTDKGY
jgi:hypothetical protein